MIVHKGDQIGFCGFFLAHQHLRSVHNIALPNIVWQLRLELSPVLRLWRLIHQAMAMKVTGIQSSNRFFYGEPDFFSF